MNVHANRFPLFDSLRAIAALSVLVFHAALFRLLTHDSPVKAYTSHLDVGVTVFFMISGFLLYRPFVRARLNAEESPHVPAYAWRRFLRIVPAYWVALTAIAIWLSLPGVFTSHGIPVYYGFLQIYDAHRAFGGIPQAWTLCVEISFYAFLPLWALLMRKLRAGVRGELVALALLWLASFGYLLWALSQISPNSVLSGPYLQPLPNFLDQFAVGMALALLSVRLEQSDRTPRVVALLRRHDWLPWVGAVVAFWVVSTRIGYTGTRFESATRRMFVGRHELYTLVALCVLLPALFATPGKGVAGRLLATRVLTFLGLVSYGIYLYQLAVVRQLNDWIGDSIGGPIELQIGLYALLALAGTALIAALSYYAVERPALRLKRFVSPPVAAERGEASEEPINPSSATAANTSAATSAGWRNRGTP